MDNLKNISGHPAYEAEVIKIWVDFCQLIGICKFNQCPTFWNNFMWCVWWRDNILDFNEDGQTTTMHETNGLSGANDWQSIVDF